MSGRAELLRLLADGAVHSGEELAAALAISRAAVWKRLQQLQAWGIALEARPGSGYRLEAPLDLIDASVIRDRLPQSTAEKLRRLEVHESLASTSDRLLAADDLPPGRFDACLAEFQSAGRGRRGRSWVAPFASGLCLSVSWSFRDAPAMLGALSLAAGVAALRALGRFGFRQLSLKWPNDIVRGEAKLGGILIDLRGEAAGPAYVVAGLGINVRLPRAAREQLAAGGVEAVDLAALGTPPARNDLAAAIITELVQALIEFGARGMSAFAEEWQGADALAGRPVRVLHGGQQLEGLARGVDGDGALLLESDGVRRRIVSGEVSVRPVR
ncbi:MAG TPA: biotin--[acetyl-CoA-carboxylase] ligase [Steroidobacteraceae bacterium]|nr:biotin--[acetyl-CoA-carboxylase] ligase [Steroidobacteraceae bacterium]